MKTLKVATLYQLPQIALLIAIVVGIMLAVATPFLAGIACFALPLVSGFDINFYPAEKPPEFIRAFTMAVGLLLVLFVIYLYLFTGWVLAVPLFNRPPPAQCLKLSKRLVTGRRNEIELEITESE